MVDRLFFSTIKFIDMTIFLDESDEMCFYLSLHLSLPLLDRVFVLSAYFFVFFEHLSDFFRFFAKSFFSEFAEVRVGFDEIIVDFVHYDVEESDGSTSIFGILFHVKNVRRYFVVL
jgi:hypothetical protein